ncbi:hypothetical protein [Cytobacillus purgationiresistens]|uniref:Transcriptional regulator n=1 Tax=Cytobacillus purgationiresistens TaxID=863449 RepID=A0ABU0AIY5_9BACI|nr:hypothetical protein [Cytobacillus purgationiresistens]MDQ0270829.1 putative transcriptional regulator [Cytobacillus purgationiresistens]
MRIKIYGFITILFTLSALLFSASIAAEAQTLGLENLAENEGNTVEYSDDIVIDAEKVCWHCTKYKTSGYFKICVEGFWSPICYDL